MTKPSIKSIGLFFTAALAAVWMTTPAQAHWRCPPRTNTHVVQHHPKRVVGVAPQIVIDDYWKTTTTTTTTYYYPLEQAEVVPQGEPLLPCAYDGGYAANQQWQAAAALRQDEAYAQWYANYGQQPLQVAPVPVAPVVQQGTQQIAANPGCIRYADYPMVEDTFYVRPLTAPFQEGYDVTQQIVSYGVPQVAFHVRAARNGEICFTPEQRQWMAYYRIVDVVACDTMNKHLYIGPNNFRAIMAGRPVRQVLRFRG